MGLKDKYRINELISFGKPALRTDDKKGVVVKRKNGKEVKPAAPSVEDRILSKSPVIDKTRKKNPIIIPNEEQESYSGETGDYIERVKYNEQELQKALDIDVDELIKKKPKDLPKVISRKAFERLQGLYQTAQQDLAEVQRLLADEQSKVEGLNSTIEDLSQRVASAEAAQENAENELKAANTRYATLLIDLQNSLTKGIQEGTERVSLESQLRGLQAEKVTFKEVVGNYEKQLLQAQDRIAELNQNILQLQNQVTEAQRDAIKANQSAATAASNSNSGGGGGGKIICNELYNQGYLAKEIWIADENFGEWLWENHRTTAIGYTIWARKVVNFMQRKPQYTKYIYKFLKPWTQQMAYQMGVVDKTHPFGWITMKIGWQFSNLVYTMYGNKFEKVLSRLNRINNI